MGGVAGVGGGGGGMTEILAANVRKVTRFRDRGEEELESVVRRLEGEKGMVRGERRERKGGEVEEEVRDYVEREVEVVERTPRGNHLLRGRR